jgi:hypothetical protein
MDFIMPGCTNFKHCLHASALALLCLCPAPAQTAESDPAPAEFVIERAASSLVEGVYVLDADIAYGFTPEVLEALDNGVPLILELQIEVAQPRQWLWDAVFTTLQQRYRLGYHALTQQYLVENLNSATQYNYASRADAIRALGTISGLPLLDQRLLTADESYVARAQVSLDLESLPTPLRLVAYLSSQWHLTSEWYVWPLQP